MPEAPLQQLTPPDMQGAGQPQPAPQGGILDALRSLGGSPPQSMGQANPGTAFGSGVLSAIGGQPGANPYLQGVQSQANSGFYQQFNLMQEQRRQQAQMQDQQERKLDRDLRENQAYLKMAKDTLEFLPEGPARDQVAKDYAGFYAKTTKSPISGPLAANLAKKNVSAEDIDGIMMDAANKMDPALIALRHPGVPAEKIQEILKTDPRTIDRITESSSEERRGKQVKRLIDEATLAEKQMPPELRKDPILTKAVLAAHQKLNGGKDYSEGDAQSQAAAFRFAVLQQRQDEFQKFMQEETIKAQFHLKLAQATKGMQPIGETPMIFVDKAGNPADPSWTKAEAVQKGFFAITPKEFEATNLAQQAMVILQNMKATTEEMKKEHLFVESSGPRGLVEQLKIGSRRIMGDPDTSKRLLGTFDSQKAQMVILLRQLGDKGVRALGAMSPAMDALNTSRGAGSVDTVLGQIESEFRSLGQKSRTPDVYTEVPTVYKRRPPADAAGKRQLTPEQYKALKAKGATDEQIQEKYALP